MSDIDQQRTILLFAIMGMEAALFVCLHYLHKWWFPAPFWNAADRTFTALVALLTTLWEGVVCFFAGHDWRTHRYIEDKCHRCGQRRLAQ